MKKVGPDILLPRRLLVEYTFPATNSAAMPTYRRFLIAAALADWYAGECPAWSRTETRSATHLIASTCTGRSPNYKLVPLGRWKAA
jgi:hypothetical protein